MKTSIPSIICAVFLVVSTASSTQPDKTSAIPDFSLRNVDGTTIGTTDFENAKGFIVIFTCNHCPFAKLYTKRMNELSSKYSPLHVPLLAINSMDTLMYEEESFANMKLKAKSDSFIFPYLQDDQQTVGNSFGAEHTPTVYVIWKVDGQWQVRYQGSIDDNGKNPELATPFIANAVDELLRGKTVTNSETESFGCRIFYRK